MGISTSEVGYTSATRGRGDYEVHKEHVVVLKKIVYNFDLEFSLPEKNSARYYHHCT
jgi:hypothetical protein